MAIHGIGVDLLHVPRMVALVHRRGPTRIASRILSPAEVDTFRRLPPDAATRFLGVRWAVKEAAYKALHPFKPTWKELTYTSFPGSKPALAFHPDGGDVPLPSLHVSVSHDGEYIVAHVVAERGRAVDSDCI